MTTELATYDHQGSGLALSAEQDAWNQKQLAALTQIGVQNASEGDLAVFMHVCQRSGLDPFARQIYMIGRNQSEFIDGEWKRVVKQTIQTGIDGFRLIGRRAADRSGHKISVPAIEWAHEDGSWRPVWRKVWGFPVAARATIMRDGEPFTATALFDEYAQTKSNGDLTAMWAQRPAGQLAKCAEALAWRMAFPQDLSGIYTDDEMGQADNTHDRVRGEVVEQPTSNLAAALAADETTAPASRGDGDAAGGPEFGEDSGPPAGDGPEGAPDDLLNIRGKVAGKMFALFGDNDMGGNSAAARADRIKYVNSVINHDVESSKEMLYRDAYAVIEQLEADLQAKRWGTQKGDAETTEAPPNE